MFRTLLCSLAAVMALSTVTAGVADASPAPADRHHCVPSDTVTCPVPPTNLPPRGEHFPPNHNPGPFPPRGGVWGSDWCQYRTWDGFPSQLRGSWARGDWDRERGARCGGPVVVQDPVVVNGDCTVLRTNQTRYYNDYRLSVLRWNEAANRFRGHRGPLSLEQRRELDVLHLGWTRNRDLWDRTHSQRTVVCKDDDPQTIQNIIVQPAPVTYSTPAPVTVTQSAPAPVVSAPAPVTSSQLSVVPKGSADTGDGSVFIG